MDLRINSTSTAPLAGTGVARRPAATAGQEGFSTASQEARNLGFGAGMGLPNIRRNADAFSIQSTPGVGTRTEARFTL